MIKVDFER